MPLPWVASGQIDEDDGVPCILEADKSSK